MWSGPPVTAAACYDLRSHHLEAPGVNDQGNLCDDISRGASSHPLGGTGGQRSSDLCNTVLNAAVDEVQQVLKR